MIGETFHYNGWDWTIEEEIGNKVIAYQCLPGNINTKIQVSRSFAQRMVNTFKRFDPFHRYG